MKSSNQAIKNYIDSLPEERKNAIESNVSPTATVSAKTYSEIKCNGSK
jgi:hypothetical protein